MIDVITTTSLYGQIYFSYCLGYYLINFLKDRRSQDLHVLYFFPNNFPSIWSKSIKKKSDNYDMSPHFQLRIILRLGLLIKIRLVGKNRNWQGIGKEAPESIYLSQFVHIYVSGKAEKVSIKIWLTNLWILFL